MVASVLKMNRTKPTTTMKMTMMVVIMGVMDLYVNTQQQVIINRTTIDGNANAQRVIQVPIVKQAFVIAIIRVNMVEPGKWECFGLNFINLFYKFQSAFPAAAAAAIDASLTPHSIQCCFSEQRLFVPVSIGETWPLL
jgi:hypothetical protein